MTSKRDIQINWQLPNVPIWVNVAGPRGAGKRHLAIELFKCCRDNIERGWGIRSIAVFFPGNIGRFIASKIDLTEGQDDQIKQAREYFRNLRERIESGSKTDLELIAKECAVWQIDTQNVEEHLISRFNSAAIERCINSFEYDKPIRENLRQILRRIRDFLSDDIQSQLIISANPGHFPTSTLNFFERALGHYGIRLWGRGARR